MQFLKSLNSRVRENDLFWEDHQLDSLIPKEEETHVCFSDLSSNGASLMARKESMDWILTVKAHYRFSAVAIVLAMNISRRSVSSSSSSSPSFGLFCNSSNTKKHFSVDELRKLLFDKDAYHQFLLSLDQVKIQNNGRTWKMDHALWSSEISAELLEQQSWLLHRRSYMSLRDKRKKC
ncbi:vacuolar protein-sorting-associated protein 37 homolog 2-like isoform X1 [Ziziphus jujuba]|uniref:Vacuolar protein-sorting-associated protein 37 homolog 2-like isoform X1 n=1 Tax=Ziziphus jujuba TaxID=326968 RepID=A0ABM3ZVJ3_ZIZJJ|nr:vacuolar protein-sorting-associated protein 37 homolog 2-like isoform X1 [Ziziphus jujuba]